MILRKNPLMRKEIFKQTEVDCFNAMWFFSTWKINVVTEQLVWHVETQTNDKIFVFKVDQREEG